MASNLVAVKDKVQRILTNEFNSIDIDKNGRFSLRYESARLFVYAVDQEKRVVINLECPLLFKVKPTPELYKHLALHGDDFFFGHLSATETDDGIVIMFTHSLLGDYLDEQELLQAVFGVLGKGNDLDDELQGKFGGEKMHE